MLSQKIADAWVVSVNMGYGHERAAYALRDLAHGPVLAANDYPGIPEKDRRLWRQSRSMYEAISRLKPIPVIGNVLFSIMDSMQRIAPFYPRRDLSAPNLQVKQTYYTIEKLGMARHLVEKLSKKPLPLICTFFTAAFAAEVYDYPGDIYLVICDADMARAWVPRDPKKSRIKYFASNGRVVERLKLYGIREENIYFTGFPLPKELIGGPEGDTVREDLKARLCNLDPKGIFLDRYQKTLAAHLGADNCRLKKTHPLTLTFAVGGAGAQRTLGLQILSSLKHKIMRREIRIRLAAGTKKDVGEFFTQGVKDMGMSRMLGEQIFVDVYDTRTNYFREFTKHLRTTDILWTKPSEMSFYTGVGLPIVMAPSIGSQEDFNRIWLKTVGGGVSQADPRHVSEWLFDWINSGGLARMAWNGYIEAPTHGAYRIESIVTGKPVTLEKLPLIV